MYVYTLYVHHSLLMETSGLNICMYVRMEVSVLMCSTVYSIVTSVFSST